MAKLLLIEPDLKLGNIYKLALENAGHEVSHCQNAQSAVHLVDDFKPDLVILELELAVHNGVEFLYEFRSYPEWQNIPALIVSHVVPGKAAHNPKAWGQLKIAGYLYKPTTKLQDIIISVERTLDSNTATIK